MALIGSQTASPASALVIEELSGDQRQLMLLGRALPYKGFELSGTMRAQITYYAGNPVGTIQVLGAQEEPTNVNGQWKDRFIQTTDYSGALVANQQGAALLDGVALPDVKTLVKTVDDFRRKGQLLEVRWDEQTRRGILTKFTVKWQNVHDVEWEAQFTWISQGEDQAAPTFSEADQQSIAADLQNAASNAVSSAALATGLPANGSIFSSLQTLATEAESAAQEAQNTVSNTVTQAMSPIDSAYRMMAVLQRSAIAAQGLMDFVTQRVPRAIIGLPIGVITFGQTLTASLSMRQMYSDSRSYRNTALRNREAMLDKVGLRAAPQVHIMQQGEDLRIVSIRAYGNADDWRRIALFNGYGGAQVPAGTQILIPPATRDASRAGVA